ncbi:S41 family peptidase [Burkholderiaceae bacterium DAT-1]|nr:S41 family peptidase [Burkholderiaceae bacterium DAT-1]
MQPKFQRASWVLVGVSFGALLMTGVHALAEKESVDGVLPINELRTFAEVYGRVKRDYVEPVDDKKLIDEAIKGMITGLDPHSDYMHGEAFHDLQVQTSGEFGGLGIEIAAEDGLVKVVAPYDDTPAFKAGVKSGDLIYKIDDTLVRGLSLTDAVKRMRGKPKTKVVLTILRKGESKPLVLTLMRDIIKIRTVRSQLLEPGYGYVRLSQFQEHSAQDLAVAINGLYKENKEALKGLVLDLRSDPGGVLTTAVGVSSIFLPENKLVVYMDGRTADSKAKFFSNDKLYWGSKDDPFKQASGDIKNVPLVVLINGGSASASEIVAGALQDYKRAIIVGTQSFGKGSVQTIMPVGKEAAVKLTTARYFTPTGRSIQAKGITPDIDAPEPMINGIDPDTYREREADLEGHLNNPQGGSERGAPKKAAADKAVEQPKVEKRKPAAEETPDDEADTSPERAKPSIVNLKRDTQLQQGLNVLKVQQVITRNAAAK